MHLSHFVVYFSDIVHSFEAGLLLLEWVLTQGPKPEREGLATSSPTRTKKRPSLKLKTTPWSLTSHGFLPSAWKALDCFTCWWWSCLAFHYLVILVTFRKLCETLSHFILSHFLIICFWIFVIGMEGQRLLIFSFSSFSFLFHDFNFSIFEQDKHGPINSECCHLFTGSPFC